MRRNEAFLVFGSPAIGEEEADELQSVLASGWLGTGPRVARFEQGFAQYRGAEHAVAVNSCSAALHLALIGAGVGPGDEVITTPLTFCATVNAIIHTGATPVLADIDPETQNIDPAQIRARITPRTKAILPVHFAGRACDMDAIGAIAQEHHLKLIEDCAHAIETEYRGRSVGTLGDFGCFSFYVTKNMTTGEGGMVFSKSAADAARIKMLSMQGMSKDAWKRFGSEGYKHYHVVEAGFKYNMMDMQAALGLRQLEKVERHWLRRAAIWARYEEAFADLPIGRPAPPEVDTKHAHHLYTVAIDVERCGLERDAFLDAMTTQGIGVGVHYLALTEHPHYQQRFGWSPEDTPKATLAGRQTVSLPLSAKLSDADVDDVIAAVRHAVRATSKAAATSDHGAKSSAIERDPVA